MTVCAKRTDTPGFFTPCTTATGSSSCACGDEVAAELLVQTTEEIR